MIRAGSRKRFVSLLFGMLVWVLASPGARADESGRRHDPVVGGGAHFSWIIFHELKPELEKLLNRDIELYGKDSALGLGCNAGIKNAMQNAEDHETFGFVCCTLAEREIREKNLQVYPLAREPILILVNRDNPVENLSLEQARALFRGEIRNWAEVGGEDRPVVVITRLHCKKRPGHWKRILPRADLFRKDRLNVKAADEMVRRVSDFRGAIGHTGATWTFDAQDRVKPVRINGFAPTAANLKTGRYPFYRVLSAVTAENSSDDVRKLIREVQQGRAFRHVARKYELLPLNEVTP